MLFFYLGATTGVAITTHYCMGEIAGMALGHQDTDYWGTCGMDNSGCCHDDLAFHKLGDNHQQVTSTIDIPVAVPSKPERIADLLPINKSVFLSANERCTTPTHLDRNIFFCVFRI